MIISVILDHIFSDVCLLLDFLLALFKLFNIDQFSTGCIDFFHLLYFRLKFLFGPSHHLVLAFAVCLLLEVLLKILGYGLWVTHITSLHK